MFNETIEMPMNNIMEEPHYTVMPPEPPVIQILIIPGEFNYIKSNSVKDMLQNAYQAVSQPEMWNFVKTDIESFSFSASPEIRIISNKMVELGYDGHSGFSFGWTMRQIQFVAKYGEEKYKQINEN